MIWFRLSALYLKAAQRNLDRSFPKVDPTLTAVEVWHSSVQEDNQP